MIFCSAVSDSAGSLATKRVLNQSLICFAYFFRHGDKCAGVIAAVLNNSNCGVGLAFNARLGGKLKGSVTYGMWGGGTTKT